MKSKFKKLCSVILAVTIIASVVLSLDFSVSAVESEDVTCVGTEIVSEQTVANVTEPSETTAPTQPVIQPSEPVTQPTTIPQTTPTIRPVPTVGKVKNIVKTSTAADQITLKWDCSGKADGFYIYYCNADSSKTFKKIADIKSKSCVIKNLSATTQYHFKVSAYCVQDGVKYEGQQVLKKTATQPSAVSNLHIVRSSSVLEFSWNRNTKATGYKIYRASGSTNGKFVAYKTIKGNSTTSFADKNVTQGKAYYYKVYAYRELYNGSYTSTGNVVRFVCGMGAPGFSMTSNVSRVNLSWTKNKYAQGYDIYYATSKSGKYTKLGTTTNNFFNTVRLTNNKTYYFRVQPYKLNGANKTKIVGTYNTKSQKVTNGAYGKNIGKSYIEISLKQQHMWIYKNGELVAHTDVVTGNDDGYHNTPKGAFTIFQRNRNARLVGPGYVTYVDYWLGFTYSGVGIHDSTWRYSGYGGTIYKGDGSHGCINTPYNAVKKFYNNAYLGMYVVVY